LTETFVTGMPIKWIRQSASPIGIGAKPAGARLSVAPRMMNRKKKVSTNSDSRQAPSP
jgi:hypothetical protein